MYHDFGTKKYYEECAAMLEEFCVPTQDVEIAKVEMPRFENETQVHNYCLSLINKTYEKGGW